MKKVLFVVFLFLILITCNGCKKEEVLTPSTIITNQTVNYLKFFIPDDFEYLPDNRGMLYTENDRKIFSKKLSEDDNDKIYIDIVTSYLPKSITKYITELNNSLEEDDIKYVEKTNDKGLTIYAREKFITTSNELEYINYVYIINIDGYNHVVSVNGLNSSSQEIEKVVFQLFESFQK